MDGGERRRHERNKMEITLVFRVGDEKFSAQTFDLGEGGIGVISEREIKPGAEVEIKFKNKDNYTLRGSVKWSTPVPNGPANLYRIGIETGRIKADLIV